MSTLTSDEKLHADMTQEEALRMVERAGNKTSKDEVKARRRRWPVLTDEQYAAQWIERVKARCIITESGCWMWQGFCHAFKNMKPGQRGYGSTTYRSKGVHTHRKMLELKLAVTLTPKEHACHTCDNPPCCNPDHLYAADNSQNHQDGAKRGRMQGQWKTHCKHGHEFTPENTFKDRRANGAGSRHCKTCARIRSRIRLGWTWEEAEAAPLIPAGAPTKRRLTGSIA